jgi:hypothetical protein
MTWFWLLVGLTLAGLLLVAWRMDAAVRRRGSRVLSSADVWYEVREGRRDAEARSPYGKDDSWTSWSRRNRR